MDEPYYRPDLSLVHHRGFGFHADRCAPGILHLLRRVLEHQGTVLELGCGSGLLTRHLLDAGHRVIATDASPAMLEIAAEYVPDAHEIRQLVLPTDPLPEVAAVVSVGHVLSYLATEDEIRRALGAAAAAIQPGGLLAIDICDLEWGRYRHGAPPDGRVGEDWAIFTEYSTPALDKFVRSITTFFPTSDGTWRRDDEVHENVLIDASRIPEFLEGEGISVEVATSFGGEQLPTGLVAVIGRRPW